MTEPDEKGWTGDDAAPRFDPNLGYRPTVSVVVLSHRADPPDELLFNAVRSVKRQTFPAEEIELVVKHGTVYHGHKLNQALQACAGEFLVPCLPDDDELHPDFLAETVRVLRFLGDACDFVYTNVFLFGGPDGDREVPMPAEFNTHTASLQAFPWMTFLIRRRALLAVSPARRLEWLYQLMGIARPLAPYDPRQQYLDWDLGRTMARHGLRGAHVPLPLYRVREHPGNGHKHMRHGDATFAVRNKAVQLGPPTAVLPEFHYPPWYPGRPDILENVS